MCFLWLWYKTKKDINIFVLYRNKNWQNIILLLLRDYKNISPWYQRPKQKFAIARKTILCRNKKFDVARKAIWCQQKQVDAARKSVSCQQKMFMLHKKKYFMLTKTRWYCPKKYFVVKKVTFFQERCPIKIPQI